MKCSRLIKAHVNHLFIHKAIANMGLGVSGLFDFPQDQSKWAHHFVKLLRNSKRDTLNHTKTLCESIQKKNYTAQNFTLQCLELEFISILFPLPVCRKYLFQLDQYCVKGIKMSYYIWTHNCYWIMPKIFGMANYCFKAGCWTKGHFGSRKFHLLHIGTQILSSPMPA